MKISFLKIVLSIAISISFVFPQSYLGKNRSIQITESDIHALYNGKAELQKMADFFFSKSYSDIEKLAKSKNIHLEIEESNFFVEGKRVRMDMNMMDQKSSFIVNLETRKAYNIMYSQKAYIEMGLDELKELKENMQQTMSAQMESMKGMMENLPPEAKAAMEEMYGNKEDVALDLKATGKFKNINGFPCKEYLIVSNEEHEQAWVTSEYPEIKAAFFEIFKAMPGDDNEGKKWEQTDGWPIQTSHISARKGYVEGNFRINETYSLQEATHKAGTFDPPTGFKKRTMQEMMPQMPQH